MAAQALEKITNDPVSNELYRAVLHQVDGMGSYNIEPKKTSIHLVNDRAFLGLAYRKGGLALSIMTGTPIESERLRKKEQLSANRYHSELVIHSVDEIDEELLNWIREAYLLTL